MVLPWPSRAWRGGLPPFHLSASATPGRGLRLTAHVLGLPARRGHFLTRASDSSRLERRSERTLKLASMSIADLLHGASRGRHPRRQTPSGFQMHCRLAIAGAWLMLFCTSATARVVLLTCRDGGSDVVQAFGRRVKGLGLCDLDKA